MSNHVKTKLTRWAVTLTTSTPNIPDPIQIMYLQDPVLYQLIMIHKTHRIHSEAQK